MQTDDKLTSSFWCIVLKLHNLNYHNTTSCRITDAAAIVNVKKDRETACSFHFLSPSESVLVRFAFNFYHPQHNSVTELLICKLGLRSGLKFDKLQSDRLCYDQVMPGLAERFPSFVLKLRVCT